MTIRQETYGSLQQNVSEHDHYFYRYDFFTEDEKLLIMLEVENIYIRSWIIEHIGTLRLLDHPRVSIIDREGTSYLIKYEQENGLDCMFVVVKDSSTSQNYVLQVPTDMITCKAAIAWTFELSEQEYKPIIET